MEYEISDNSPVVAVSKKELSLVIGLSVLATYMAVIALMGAAAVSEHLLGKSPVESSLMVALATVGLGLSGLIVTGIFFRRRLPRFLSKEWVEKRQMLTLPATEEAV